MSEAEAPVQEPSAPVAEPPETPEGAAGAPGAEPEAGVNAVTATLGATFAAAAAAWLVAGIFSDFTAHLVALGGVLLGGGMVLLCHRFRWPSAVQYAVIPVSLLGGAALVGPDSRGSGGLAVQIGEALRSGGLLQAPIAFDPGWRFLLFVLFALLTAGAASLGVALVRPKLGVAVLLPLTMGAALVQPPASEVGSVVVALLLAVVGITLAFGAELSGEGQARTAFEMRRVLRGGAIAAGLGVAMIVLSNLGFLFPQPNQNHTVPPQRPQVPPPPADQVLFTYQAARFVPLRLGVIDTYDLTQHAFLLPEYDARRLERIVAPHNVPGVRFKPAPGDITVKVTVGSMGTISGHALPDLAELDRIGGTDQAFMYDPRTGALTLAERPAYQGLTYTLIAEPLATGAELAKAPAAEKGFEQYLVAPPPPNQVVALLTKYSQRTAQLNVPEDPFDRVQFLRQALYNSVVAAGPGTPVDMTSSRVADMLGGADANPYEIVAAEALLARWAGVPSRIGYGYYGGDKVGANTYAVHPRQGSMWLEVYFPGTGWTPLVGTPPRAKPSTSQQQKNQTNSLAVDQLQLIVYIPVREPSALLFFEYARWWALRIAPAAVALIVLLVGYPWLLKFLRRSRRRRWGRSRGLSGRVAVAYAEFRDRARDLTIGDPGASPIGFLDYVKEDAEHEELAWLVTRALWGDLRRDLQPEDAEAAERLAASVARRLDAAQPELNRLLARIARTSFREPYDSTLPNPWFELRLRFEPRRRYQRWRRARRVKRSLGPRRVAAALAGAIVVSSCGVGVAAQHPAKRTLPTGLVPASIGAYTFKEEKAAEHQYVVAGPDAEVSKGLVYTIHHDVATDGAIEVALFKPDLTVDDINDESLSAYCAQNRVDCPGHEILVGIQANLGSGHFQRLYYKNQRAYMAVLSDQTIYLWFPPRTETMVMLILLGRFAAQAGDPLFQALLDYEHHRPAGPIPVPAVISGPAPAASPPPSPEGTPSPSESPSPGGTQP